MTGRRIVVFGDVIDDIVVVPAGPIRPDTDTPSSIVHRPGGSAANAAAWLGYAGAAVDFVGMVGAADGERHAAALAACGVTPHLEAHPTLPTGAIVVLVEGQNRSMLTERGANAALGTSHVTDELLDSAAHLHFSGYSIYGSEDVAGIRELMKRAETRGVTVSVDPGSAGFLSDYGVERFMDVVCGATILLPNLDEGRVITGRDDPEHIVAALTEHWDVVALTLGETGALVATRDGEMSRAGADRVVTVDPTGAGDAFSAGFLESWLRDRDPRRAAEAGVALAALAVTGSGGRPSP